MGDRTPNRGAATLQSWSFLGRASGEVRRLDRAGHGIFAAGLLAHLDHIKEDRLKTGADLIARAALGFVRDQAGRWEQRFLLCDAVLFEDLSRYRMRTDRPRREDSQLMRWAHRGIPQEVEMQDAVHGRVSGRPPPSTGRSAFSTAAAKR